MPAPVMALPPSFNTDTPANAESKETADAGAVITSAEFTTFQQLMINLKRRSFKNEKYLLTLKVNLSTII